MAYSVDRKIVAPSLFINKPQTHFAKLRLEEDYHVELNGKHVKGTKHLNLDVSAYLAALKDQNYSSLDETEIMKRWPWQTQVDEVVPEIDTQSTFDNDGDDISIDVSSIREENRQ